MRSLSNYHITQISLFSSIKYPVLHMDIVLSPNELLQVNPLEKYIYRKSSAKRKHHQHMDTILCSVYTSIVRIHLQVRSCSASQSLCSGPN
ncbi:hypothetical protein JHK85_014267 [Glycine max]|nr:hypothetical protein JHK85_014267 [Glycine max]KAG5058905.1 hypothetical protein JHK86_013901 [Glycine max]KHN21648.1 hypothetical protein glysoja_023500 [Glycine soja]